MDGAQVGLLGHSKAPKRSLNLLRDEPRPLSIPQALSPVICHAGCFWAVESVHSNKIAPYAVFALNDGICAYKHSNAVSSQYGIDYTVQSLPTKTRTLKQNISNVVGFESLKMSVK